MKTSTSHELNCKECNHTAISCAFCKNGNQWKPAHPNAQKYSFGYKPPLFLTTNLF